MHNKGIQENLKTGRNDPCPCNSGKKYKKCCGPKEDEKRTHLLPTITRHIQKNIEPSLIKHMADLYGPRALESAWDDFWDDDEGPPSDAPDENNLQWFIPWCLFHWLPSEATLEECGAKPVHHTIGADYLVKKGARLSAEDRDYLTQSLQEPFTLWEILETDPGRGVKVRDLLLNRTLFVNEISGSRSIQKWAIILAKTVTLSGTSIFDGSHPYALPPEDGMRFVEGMRRGLKKLSKKNPDKKVLRLAEFFLMPEWADYCKACFDRPPPQLRNTDGEKIVFVTARWAFDGAEREEIRKKLAGIQGMLDEEEDEEDPEKPVVMVWHEKGNRLHATWDNTVIGNLRLYKERLELETNSRERSQKLATRIEKRCGDRLRFDGRTEKSLEDLHEDVAGMKKEKKEPEIPAEVKQQIVGEFLEKHYAAWVNDKIPALDNKTPLETVKTAKGREQVEQLIREMEFHDSRKGNPNAGCYDFNKLRGRLGLKIT